jgi:hypothetical protein
MATLVDISELVGKTLYSITGAEVRGHEILFNATDGSMYKMYHEQDCCEDVYLEDICGDISDLLGTPILLAEEVVNSESPRDYTCYGCTWTFYKLVTNKGAVTLRWYGESNGYYSERVNIKRLR